jgi:hypothetical protein
MCSRRDDISISFFRPDPTQPIGHDRFSLRNRISHDVWTSCGAYSFIVRNRRSSSTREYVFDAILGLSTFLSLIECVSQRIVIWRRKYALKMRLLFGFNSDGACISIISNRYVILTDGSPPRLYIHIVNALRFSKHTNNKLLCDRYIVSVYTWLYIF